jgi:hypothetical protein
MVGLDITAGNSTVQGLAINRFDSAGIRLQTNGGNEIVSNHIGTDLRVRSIGATAGGSGLMAFQIIGSRTT